MNHTRRAMFLAARTLAGALALTLAAGAVAQSEMRTFDVPLSRPGEPLTMEIDLINGEIYVVGEDREDVQLEIESSGADRTIVTPSGPKRISGGALQLEIEEYDNELSIDSDARSGGIVIRARVPRRSSLSLETVHDGVIDVRDITGNLELDNVHGPIRATGIRGAVVAETVHGDVEIELIEVPDDKPLAMETLHGDIELSLPDDYGAELHIISASDEVYTDFEVDLVPFEPKAVKREDGRFMVELEREIVARINGGGPRVMLETRYGDVRVLKTRMTP